MSLYSLTQLRNLRLDNNPLSGSIDSNISLLQKLSVLRLGSSNIGGSIPDSLYQLPKLKILDLSNADLNGTLSSSIASLNNTLKDLILANNRLYGSIPESLGHFGVLGKLSDPLIS